jgi:hypothetical protein
MVAGGKKDLVWKAHFAASPTDLGSLRLFLAPIEQGWQEAVRAAALTCRAPAGGVGETANHFERPAVTSVLCRSTAACAQLRRGFGNSTHGRKVASRGLACFPSSLKTIY